MCIILTFLLLTVSLPAYATVLYECGFEPTGDDCLVKKDGNQIGRFTEFQIPRLPGGGEYVVTAKTHAKINSEDVRWYRQTHHTPEIFIRLYVYFPHDYQASGSFALKFLNVDDSSPCLWCKAVWKLAQRDGGKLWIGAHAGIPERKKVEEFMFADDLTRGEWHYLEFHHYNSPDGIDIVEGWLDHDSRLTPADIRDAEVGIYPEEQGRFDTIHMNINWSGFEPPWDQQFYVDGLSTSDKPIGDTYGLLGKVEDTVPPRTPAGLQVE